MNPSGPAWLPCPVCGAPVAGPAPCPSCGLPAAGQAALVMARIGATLTELSRDREALLASLRAAAPGYGTSVGYAAAPPVPPPPPVAPVPPAPPAPPAARPPARVRRLSPQQVLLALGALLLVAGALAFVALGWSRLGLAFQAAVMAVVTGAACAASAWTARRRLRATEEALAAAGAALLAVDLGAAYGKNLLGIDALPVRLWAALACGVVVIAALALGRVTRSTVTWPLVALLAGQPVVFLLLPPGLVGGPAGVAALFAVAAADVVAALRLRAAVAPLAAVLAGLGTLTGAAAGLAVAASADPLRSWPATATLAVAGGALQFLVRVPRAGHRLPRPAAVAAAAAGVTGAALACSCDTAGPVGPVAAAVLGLVAACAAAVLVRSAVLAAAAAAAGAGLLLVSGADLAVDGRNGTLALVLLGLVVPALLAAAFRPGLRAGAAGVAVLAPVGAVLVAHAGGQLAATPAGLLLALAAAAAFAAATLRARTPEEPVLATAGAVAGIAAAAVGGSAHAWGQVGVQLAIAGAAAACYAVVVRRHWVGVLAVADLVVGAWIALAGAAVGTPEAYTLPAAAGLLLAVLPRLRSGAGSWSAEGAAAAVAVVPSALLVVSQPTVLRLVLVVVGALALTVAGTLTHRQAPFVVGAGALAFVVLTRLGPYAPLLPRWLVLAVAGLVLLALGATYERRRQQARDAVAWVAHMH
jgi:hypothetical protein